MAPRLFNITSSYDENVYTTRLDKSALTKDQRARAERMAAEIESKSSGNIHMREERNMVRAGCLQAFGCFPFHPMETTFRFLCPA